MKPVEPIYILQLFPPLGNELLSVLKALQPADWMRPTACGTWHVKDVAAHLLGGSFGRIWARAEHSIQPFWLGLDYEKLVDIINAENELWVRAAQRISPSMLIELLELTDCYLYEHFSRLDPAELAGISVAWASDDLAPNWFDIAREYTEKWLHQQHIREAVDLPLLTGRAWLSPVLDTFMRGLPRTFRNMHAVHSVSIAVQITGEAGGEWSVVSDGEGWQLYVGSDPEAISNVHLGQDLAWRLFTKGVSLDDARLQVQIEGNQRMGEKVLELVSIMA